MKHYIYAKQIVLDEVVVEHGYLTIEDGKFGEILTERPTDADIVEYPNSIVSAG